jgi:hypothetical protein
LAHHEQLTRSPGCQTAENGPSTIIITSAHSVIRTGDGWFRAPIVDVKGEVSLIKTRKTHFNKNTIKAMFSHGKRLDECYPLSCTNAVLRDAEMVASSTRAAVAAASSPLKKARSVDFLGRLSIRSASLTEGPLSTAASQFSRRAARGVYSNGYVSKKALPWGDG